MNTKEQLEVVARRGGWEADNSLGAWFFTVETQEGPVPTYLNYEDAEALHPILYAALMPEWQKVGAELVIIWKAGDIATSSKAAAIYTECVDMLRHDRTLSDFLASLSNAILWIESTKK